MPVTTSKTKKKQDDYNALKNKSSTGFGRRATFDLDLPSGNIITVKRPGVQGLMKAGILESLDSLTSIVQTETIPKAEGQPQVDIKKIMDNPEQLQSMMDMMDRIVLYVVIRPKLSPKPTVHEDPEDDNSPVVADPTDDQVDALRSDDEHYVDLVDDEDKTFIMQFVLGGSKDLATFREATEEAVASSQHGEAAEGSTE